VRTLPTATAGYDLKQLFIGAEGTLGIITAACLRIYPAVNNAETALLAIASPDAAVEVLATLRDGMSDQLQAFELIPARAIQFVLQHIPETRNPMTEETPWLILVEVSGVTDKAAFERQFMTLYEKGLISDAVVAKNRSEASALWRVRHSISEAQKREGASLKHDVSVPVGEVGRFIVAAEAAVDKFDAEIRPVPFGHVGDGNIHFNLSQPKNGNAEAFLAQREALASLVYDVVASFGGSISAEHGVGQAKRADLLHYRGETEIGLMRALKDALDPANILNPGKVI
jgi:FAD/FMN-containing dehydrogenase